jgi:HK97 family phage major capsid protein
VKNVAGTENVGGYANKVYDAEKGTLKGRPIKFVEYCPTLGTRATSSSRTSGAYLAGVRSGGVQSAVSMHVRFEYSETAFRFKFAVDGQPWLGSALTPFKGSNTLSTFVALQTR